SANVEATQTSGKTTATLSTTVRPLPWLRLHACAKAGALHAFEGETFLADRFFAGGASGAFPVRGFVAGSVGPHSGQTSVKTASKQSDDSDALGGTRVLHTKAEVSVSPSFMRSDESHIGVEAFAFADGAACGNDFALHTGHVASAGVGLGFRIGKQLRIDLSHALWHHGATDASRFSGPVQTGISLSLSPL
ncbi:MAG: hypothetical protein MHM6MM_004894, partial [Cercozoa sp. M6MM]